MGPPRSKLENSQEKLVNSERVSSVGLIDYRFLVLFKEWANRTALLEKEFPLGSRAGIALNIL